MSRDVAGVTLKLATSLDGRIALANGQGRWITGEAARAAVHRLRARHAVVVVGVGTVLADDPALDVRLPDHQGPQPHPVVADSLARTPCAARIVARGGTVVCGQEAPTAAIMALRAQGARVVVAPTARPSPAFILSAVEAQGPVMLEGGGELAASFLRADLVASIHWFRAPVLLGADARAAIGPLGLTALAQARGWRRVALKTLDADTCEVFERADARGARD